MRFFILILFNILCHFITFKNVNSFDHKSFFFFLNRHKRYAEERNLEPPKLINVQKSFVTTMTDHSRVYCTATGNPSPKIKWYYETTQRNVFTEVNDPDRFVVGTNGDMDIFIQANIEVIYCKAQNELGTVRSKTITVQKWIDHKDVKVRCETKEVSLYQKAVINCLLYPTMIAYIYYVRYWEIRYKSDSKKVLKIYKTEGRFSVINKSQPPQLHIRNVTKADFSDMEVRCIMRNIYTDIDVKSHDWISPKRLEDNSKIDFTSICQNMEVRVIKGSTLELPWCSMPNNQKIAWYWSSAVSSRRHLVNLSGSKFKMISEDFGNLLIKNIGIAEEGFYYASNPTVPSNPYLTHTVRVMINVSVDIKPTVVNARYNEIVQLKCVATGYPRLSLLWLFNGNEFNSSKSFETDTNFSRTSHITIRVNADTAGVYQCLAESRDNAENRILSEDQKSVFVIIAEMAPLLIWQSPPVQPSYSYGTGVLKTDGSSFQIQCKFNRVPNGTVAWYLDDKKIPMVNVLIPNTTYRLPYTVIATLQIDLSAMMSIEEKWKYGGEYRAEVTNKYGKAHCTTLIFVTDVYMIRDYPDITLTHGSELRLKCYVISGLKPTIEWFRDAKGKLVRLPETHTQTVSEDGRLFIIEKVDKVIHSGKYICNSTLNNLKISKTFSVTIANPPIMLSDLPVSISLNKNSDTTSLTCLPRHQPDLPWYAWWEFKEAKSNHSVPLLSNSYLNKHDLKIEIKYQKITVSEKYTDNGAALPKGVPNFVRYQHNKIAQIWIKYNEKLHLSQISCVVQNHAGTIRKTIQISIDNLVFKESPPLDYSIVLGQSFALNCSAKPTNIQLKTNWFNVDSSNNVPVNSTVESRIHQLPNGTLVVKNIELTDPHKFMCIIKPIVGKDEISKVVKIAIKVPATILNMPDVIDMKRNYENSLNCTVHGDDELDVKWYRKEDGNWDSLPVKRIKEKSKVSRFFVKFESVTDSLSGEYKCVASNEHRKNGVERIILLNVVDVPGKVVIKNESIRSFSRSIAISWNPPNSDGKKPINRYLVSWKLVTENWFINATTKETSITIEDLRPFKEYDIAIVAENSVGYGEEATIIIKTQADAPEGPVLNLLATSVSFDKVKLKWESPNEMLINGIKKHYQVCSMEIYDSQNRSLEKFAWPSPNDSTTRVVDQHNHRVKKSCINVPESTLVITVTELLTFTEYAFRVILVNNVGFSPAKYVAIRTLEDKPEGTPIQVLCSPKANFLFLEWNPPPQNVTNGVISGYEVTYFSDDKHEEPDKLMKNVKETHLKLYNLSANSKYIIQIRVKNNIGLGPPSEPINCTTNEAAPDPPNEIKAYFYQNCLKVSWTPPIKANGHIREYIIVFSFEPNNMITVSSRENDKPYYSWELCSEQICSNCNVSVLAVTTMKGPRKTVNVLSNKMGILSFSQSIVVQNSSQVVLYCEVAFPDENIYYLWTHNDKDIYGQGVQSNGSLVINSMAESDQGIYKCKVKSEEITYNVSTKSISLVPQTPYIEITKVSTNHIALLWRSNGSPKTEYPINQFLVVIQNANGSSSRELKVSSNIRSIIIPNLECGTLYNVYLYAKNIAGPSNPAISQAQTRGSIPEIPDTSNIVTEIGPHSMCFNLRAFRPGRGCPANKYILKLWPSSEGNHQESGVSVWKVVNDSDLNQIPCFNVTDLHPNTDYVYSIEASNMVGSQKAKAHNKTRQIVSTAPPNINYSSPPLASELKYIFVAAVISVIILFVIIVVLALYCTRRSCHTYFGNRNISNNLVKPPIRSPIPVSNNRNRKLPTPPDNNFYDKGNNIISKPQDNEEDEMLTPYATYESIPKPDPMTNRDRPNMSTNYNTGSQTNSYQYPEMQPLEASNPKMMNYPNDLKQPLLTHSIKHSSKKYDKGYSRGNESLATLRPQTVRSEVLMTMNKQRIIPVISNAPGSMESEAYRPSSSLCSSTTESSTKDELRQLFGNASGNQFPSRLQEQDEDGASTARGGNRSTLINRSHHHINNTLSDDSTQPESYCESGSSGDDCGIRNFTQDPPGQQVIAPQTIRNMNLRCNSLPYDTANRQPFIQQSNNFTLQQPRNPLPEEDEGEEANNYTNNFVVV